MNIDTSHNKWIDGHNPDPRFPTEPDYVEVSALSRLYGIAEEKILALALSRPGTCLRSDGNPWVDHGRRDKSLYFHEPTLKAAIAGGTA
jgi:hypothetical protein